MGVVSLAGFFLYVKTIPPTSSDPPSSKEAHVGLLQLVVAVSKARPASLFGNRPVLLIIRSRNGAWHCARLPFTGSWQSREASRYAVLAAGALGYSPTASFTPALLKPSGSAFARHAQKRQGSSLRSPYFLVRFWTGRWVGEGLEEPIKKANIGCVEGKGGQSFCILSLAHCVASLAGVLTYQVGHSARL